MTVVTYLCPHSKTEIVNPAQHTYSSEIAILVSIRLKCILTCFLIRNTLKCLRIGISKAINFPFVSNEKLMFFRCPSIQAHCNEAVIYLNFRTPKNNEFSIWNKWKIYYF